MAIRTFLDTSVLIAGWRGETGRKLRALTILNDPQREFVCSPFVKLELLPKPTCYGSRTEVLFYEQYFLKVDEWVEDFVQMYDEAMKAGSQFGLSAVDALHIAAALIAQATEFVTAERPSSPLSRVTGVAVKTIF